MENAKLGFFYYQLRPIFSWELNVHCVGVFKFCSDGGDTHLEILVEIKVKNIMLNIDGHSNRNILKIFSETIVQKFRNYY